MEKIIELIRANKETIIGKNIIFLNDLEDKGIHVKVEALDMNRCYTKKSIIQNEDFFRVIVYGTVLNGKTIETNFDDKKYTISGLLNHQNKLIFGLDEDELLIVLPYFNYADNKLDATNYLNKEHNMLTIEKLRKQLTNDGEIELLTALDYHYEWSKKDLILNNDTKAEFIGLDDFSNELYKICKVTVVFLEGENELYTITSEGEPNGRLKTEYQPKPYSIYAISEDSTESFDNATSEKQAKKLIDDYKKQLKEGKFINPTSLEKISTFSYDQLG